MHGQFVWYELTTPDVDAAQKFYPRFTGWGQQPFDDDYSMFTNGGVPIAGMFRLTDDMRQQGVPPNWMPYVESSDVDETAAKAASLGGKVMVGPQDIPGAGRFAVIQDPQGAVFGALTPANAGGAWDGTAQVGRFSWHELMTTDYVAAFRFYRDLFGWEKTGEMDMGGGQTYFMYGKGDKAYGGMFNRFGDMASMRPFWLVYIHVKDVGTAVSAATKAGGVVHRPQMDIPGGAIAILADPQGAGFALHHANVPAAAAATTTAKKAKQAKQAKKVKKVKKAVKKAVKAVKKAVKKAATKVKSVAKKAAKSPARAKTKAKTKSRAAARSRPNAKKKTKTPAKRPSSGRGKRAARKR
jgi:predicted enzyme related to lactoylglutathione lyase